jgi:predicted nuclease of predicted toxin-antitoxin system
VRIKLDENLPQSARSALADAGHGTDTTHAEGLDGAVDRDVLAGAAADGRLLITLNRGLGDIRTYPPGSPPGSHGGVLVIRLTTRDRPSSRTHQHHRGPRRPHACIAVWRDGELRVRRP